MSDEMSFAERKHKNQEDSMKRYLGALCLLMLGSKAFAALDIKAALLSNAIHV